MWEQVIYLEVTRNEKDRKDNELKYMNECIYFIRKLNLEPSNKILQWSYTEHMQLRIIIISNLFLWYF